MTSPPAHGSFASTPPPPQPLGSLQFTTQGSFWTNSFIAPRVTIDGHPVQVPTFGTTTVPVPAGRVTVEAHLVYLYGPYGRAGLYVDVAPGQTVPVYYAPPLTAWGTGHLGVTPQQRDGLGCFIALMTGMGLVALLIIVTLLILFRVTALS